METIEKKSKSLFEGPQSYRVLQEFNSGNSHLNVSYELSLFHKEKEGTYQLPTLIIPRGPCQLDVTVNKQKQYSIGQDHILIIPAESEVHIFCKSSMYDTLFLKPTTALLEKVLETYPTTVEKKFKQLLLSPLKFNRTNWLDEVIHRYFFERVVSRANENEATRFLETEIFKEIYFVATKEGEVSAGFTRNAHLCDVTQRAIEFMENHLFDKLTIKDLAKQAKASESTLLRAFKNDLSIPPFKYLRLRRLDEAMKLLKHENVHVGDVATLLGYESFSAFSEAFKERFGVVPSSYQKPRQQRRKEGDALH